MTAQKKVLDVCKKFTKDTTDDYYFDELNTIKNKMN